MHRVLTSREFNQDTSNAKKLANEGPVIITDRGKPAHVLMTFVEYRKMNGQTPKIAELLALEEDVDLQLPERADLPRAAEF